VPVFSVAETKLVHRAAISHEIVASFFAKRIARVSSREFATRRRSLARARARFAPEGDTRRRRVGLRNFREGGTVQPQRLAWRVRVGFACAIISA
jgi:hypothetical protein